MSNPGLGYIPNLPHERARIPHLTAAFMLPALPGKASLEGLIDLRDQSESSSCVGQADQQAAYVGLKQRGVNCPKLSALSIYTPARRVDMPRDAHVAPLMDNGCRPSMAVQAMRAGGIATEAAWPFDLSKVNVDIPFDVFENANNLLPYTVDGEYAIHEQGTARAWPMMLGLSQGHAIPFGTVVDQAFMNHVGTGIVNRAKGPILGGHMMCCVGYETLPSGVVVFRVVNSWGKGWGDHGLFNASIDFFADARLDDIGPAYDDCDIVQQQHEHGGNGRHPGGDRYQRRREPDDSTGAGHTRQHEQYDRAGAESVPCPQIELGCPMVPWYAGPAATEPEIWVVSWLVPDPVHVGVISFRYVRVFDTRAAAAAWRIVVMSKGWMSFVWDLMSDEKL